MPPKGTPTAATTADQPTGQTPGNAQLTQNQAGRDTTPAPGSDATTGLAPHTAVLQGDNVLSQTPKPGTVNDTAARIVQQQNEATGVGAVRGDAKNPINTATTSAEVRRPDGTTTTTAEQRKAESQARNGVQPDGTRTAATTPGDKPTPPTTTNTTDASALAAARREAAMAKNGVTPTDAKPTDAKPPTANPTDASQPPTTAEARKQAAMERNGVTPGTTPGGDKPPVTNSGEVNSPARSLQDTRMQAALDRNGKTAPTGEQPAGTVPGGSLADQRKADAMARNGVTDNRTTAPGDKPAAPTTAAERRAEAMTRNGVTDTTPGDKPAAATTAAERRAEAMTRNGVTDTTPGDKPAAATTAAERRAEAMTRNGVTDATPGDKPAAATTAAERRAEAMTRNGVTDTTPNDRPTTAERRAEAMTRNGVTDTTPNDRPTTAERRAEAMTRNGVTDTTPSDKPTTAERRADAIARNGATDNRPATATTDANPNAASLRETRQADARERTAGLRSGDTPAPSSETPKGKNRGADAPPDVPRTTGKAEVTPTGNGPNNNPVSETQARVEQKRAERAERLQSPAAATDVPPKAPVRADVTPTGTTTNNNIGDTQTRVEAKRAARELAQTNGGDSVLSRGQQQQLDQLRQKAQTGDLSAQDQRRFDRLTALETRKIEVASQNPDAKPRTATRAETPPAVDTVKPAKADVPVEPREVRRPAVTDASPVSPNANPDGTIRPRGKDVVAANPDAPPGTTRQPFKPAEQPVMKQGDQPVFKPTGDQPVKPAAELAGRDARQAFAELRQTQNQPLDPAQQKWLAEQTAKMGDGRSQNFARNFENLSQQNRTALMNMDANQQGDMVAKLGRGRADVAAIEGKIGALQGNQQPVDLRAGRTADGAVPGAKPPLGIDALKGPNGDLIRGPGGDLARGPGGDLARGPGGDLARALQRADLKIPGLDTADPANRQFLADASLRFNNLKFDGTMTNMKVSDALQGMDPQRVMALEKFLSGNNQLLEPGKLTFGQLDQTRVMQLQGLLRGNFDMATGRQLTPQESFRQLTQNLITQPGDGSLIGQGKLTEIGKLFNDQPTAKLSDMVTRTLDARSPLSTASGGGNIGSFDIGRFDFTAKLNPVQEIHVRNLLDNSSKLAQLLENNIVRNDLTQPRLDPGKAIGLAQVLATSFGDSRGDFSVRGDVRSAAESAPRVQDAGDYVNTASGAKPADYIAKLPIDATTGLPYDPSSGKLLDPNTGRPIGDRVSEEKKSSDKKWDTDEEDFEEKEKKKRKQDSDLDAEKAKQKAMLLLLQAKKKREQELKDKAMRDQKRKEEDEKRVKYTCKDGDTVQSIALKQLRDSRVAALIYQINREIIPTKIVNGEQTPVLHAGLVIWLPSPKEIREFRSKLVSGTQPGQAQGVKEFASVEDELAARFGANWDGDGQPAIQQGEAAASSAAAAQQSPPQSSIEKKLMDDAIADAKRRRENIEAALGPIASSKSTNRAPSGQIIYQVRLGDTLRSVAQKQPSLGDVNLWRLLAEVNGLSTETDSKGQPIAGLTRGNKIKLPTQQEIADYRQRIGSMAGQPMPRGERVSKTCRTCGRVNLAAATTCPGCGYQFGGATNTASVPTSPVPTASVPNAPRDAATILMEGMNGSNGARTEDLDHQSPAAPVPTVYQGSATVNLDAVQAQPAVQPPAPETWASVKDFEAGCRLAKSAHSWETAQGKLVIQLQIKEANKDWYPILEYDIFESHAIRHSFIRETGAKKSVRIDLPAAAAMELAQNDLLANWNNYKNKFFA